MTLNANRASGLQDQTGQSSRIRSKGDFKTSYEEAALARGRIARKSKWDVLEHLRDKDVIRVSNDSFIVPEWCVWAVRLHGRLVLARMQMYT